MENSWRKGRDILDSTQRKQNCKNDNCGNWSLYVTSGCFPSFSTKLIIFCGNIYRNIYIFIFKKVAPPVCSKDLFCPGGEFCKECRWDDLLQFAGSSRESFVVRVRVSEKKTKTKCIFILVAKLLIAMVDFIVGRFVSSNWSHRLPTWRGWRLLVTIICVHVELKSPLVSPRNKRSR